ncbi:DoxX family protein [Streptomyces sp. TRM70308]|uniref:DoxX family protein n=1 Tax=Streptomyces sp. TRM70308 TaxID=3131932 RepID=UPI003CFC908B
MAPPPYQHRDHTVLALFRAVVGLLFACHGAAALFGVFGGTPGAPPTLGQWPGWWAAVIQFAGGTLVLLGVGARSAAVVCSGSMAYAYFVEHQPGALLPIENGGEAATLFCWCFLLIAALGPGRWTLDSVLPGARRAAARPGAPDTATAAGAEPDSPPRAPAS